MAVFLLRGKEENMRKTDEVSVPEREDCPWRTFEL